MTTFSIVHKFQHPQSIVKVTGTLLDPKEVTDVGLADIVVVGVPRTVEELELREAGLATAKFASSTNP